MSDLAGITIARGPRIVSGIGRMLPYSVGKRTLVRLIACLVAGLSSTTAAVAQTPAKPIKIVFPFPAGSAGDTLSRIIAQALQIELGRTVMVENRSGAGGITGVRSMIQAEADGTTLLIAPSAVVTMIPLYNPEAGYSADKDLTAISHLVSQDLALGVGPALPVKSVQELIEVVRRDLSKGSFGTPGAGSSLHLIGVKLGQVANVQMTPVHYRGAALALNDVVAGQLPMMLSPMPDQIEQHRAGTLRIIATAGTERSTFIPEVATFLEAGLDITAQGWFAAFAPAKLPLEQARQLSRQLNDIVQKPETRDRLAKIGFIAKGTTPEQLQALVNKDLNFWAPIFKASGFKP